MRPRSIVVAVALLATAPASYAAPKAASASPDGWRMESNRNACEAVNGRLDFGTLDGKEILLGVEKGTVATSLSAVIMADDAPLQLVFLKIKGGVYAKVGASELDRLLASKRLTVTWPGMPPADVSLELFPKIVAHLSECGAQLRSAQAAAAAASAERAQRLMAIGQILQAAGNAAGPSPSPAPAPVAAPSSSFHTYITPGGKMVTCTTTGTITNCM